MKRLLQILFIAGFVLSGIGLLRISYFHAKAELAQVLLESAWQKNFESNRIDPVKPWSWADTWPVLKLDLPSIELSMLILKDASGQSLAFGPGLMTPNLMPGEIGNSFIAAHRDTHFKELEVLKKYEEIQVTNRLGEKKIFQVDQISIVDSRTEQPVIESNDRRITLVTCYPFNANEANTPFRYLVSAKMIN